MQLHFFFFLSFFPSALTPPYFLVFQATAVWNKVYKAIGLVDVSLTPSALEWSLFTSDQISIFIVYQPWGSILAWMVLQMNAITGEPAHPDCMEETVAVKVYWIIVPLENGAHKHREREVREREGEKER